MKPTYARLDTMYREINTPIGTKRITFYDWVGPIDAPLRLSRPFERECLHQLPWPMVKVESSEATGFSTYMRGDITPVKRWAYIVRERGRRVGQEAMFRLGWTAILWGLATCRPDSGLNMWWPIARWFWQKEKR